MTTGEALELFLAELNAIKYKAGEYSNDEIVIDCDVSEGRQGQYFVTLKGPGGRYKFSIGKHGLGMPEMPMGNQYWIGQVYKVYERMRKVLR